MNFMHRDEEINYFPSRWGGIRRSAGWGRWCDCVTDIGLQAPG